MPLYPVDASGGPQGPRAAGRSGNALVSTASPPDWTFQAGTSGTEQATATAVCGGFIYTVGQTNGALSGQTHAGGMDVFLMKHRIRDGSLVWVEQFGSPMDDYATGVAVHGCTTSGTFIYVTGYTTGTLPGASHTGTNQGGRDIFVRKYDGSKALKWSRQRGSSKDDLSYAVAVNDTTGDVYVTGYTLGSFVTGTTASSNDVFVARYLPDGAAASAIQFGSSSNKSDIARGIAVDRNGKVYVTGYTNGVFPSQTSVGGIDMFLVKYSAELTAQEWIRQMGTPSADYGYGVAASRNASGEIELYAVGQTFGSLSEGGTLGGTTLSNAGDYDAVIFQYSDSGTKKRATLLGTQGRDSVNAIASDGGANLYVVGATTYDLRSDPGAYMGSVDAFLAKYDVNLERKSVHQYGSTSENPSLKDDHATAVFADKDDGVYLVGYTTGSIGAAFSQGGYDLFAMRYAEGCLVDQAMGPQCWSAVGCGGPHLTGRVAAGVEHALLVLPNGSVRSWGRNLDGQLGNGSSSNSAWPVTVQMAGLDEGVMPLGQVRAVAGGAKHSLALQADGSVWAWGGNASGQLGVSTPEGKSPLALRVGGLGRARAVAAGHSHSLALLQDGTVWAWGANTRGQLGDGTNAAHSVPVQVAGLSGVVGIAAGSEHSLALKTDGTVWSWGSNTSGQLGNSGTMESRVPVQVRVTGGEALEDVMEVASGAQHALALKLDGTVWAWGRGSNGQVGDGSFTSMQPEAVLVLNAEGDGPLMGIASIAVGSWHSLALGGDGKVWSWGYNSKGQLGEGTAARRALPVEVRDSFGTGVLTGLGAIAAGDVFSVAVSPDGRVWTWGYGYYGQLGNGAKGDQRLPVRTRLETDRGLVAAYYASSLAVRPDGSVWGWGFTVKSMRHGDAHQMVPAPVQGLMEAVDAPAVAVAAKIEHSLVVREDGSVWAWGVNYSGQLGDGSTADRSVPVQVQGLSRVVAVASGYGHSLAVRADGSVWAWGANWHGQLGDGSTTNRLVPVQVQGLSGVVSVAAGAVHSVAVCADGSVWTWGFNLVPMQVQGLSGVVAVAAGAVHSVAVRADGSVWTWGWESSLSDGRMVGPSVPVQVPELRGVVSVAAIEYRALAVRADGSVWAWKWVDEGGDGVKPSLAVPMQVPELSGVVSVAAGVEHSLAMREDGSVWSWGANAHGQLGDGSWVDRAVPVQAQMPWLSGVTALVAGYSHLLAVRTDGSVWAWGANDHGQLGDGSTTNRSVPVQVQGLSGVVSVAAGFYHSLAVRTDGSVWAWGVNDYGQLGDGSTMNRLVPVQVQDLSGVVSVAAGFYHSLAVRTDGSVWAWGANWYGQLGDGSTTNRSVPVQVQGLSGVVSVAAGLYHSLAVRADGSVWAWGANDRGQLGDGSTMNRLVPVQVQDLSGVVSAGAGAIHSWAVRADGSAWVWGYNGYAQLGHGLSLGTTAPDAPYSLNRRSEQKVYSLPFASPRTGQMEIGAIGRE
ncbi:Alpha-tubulin suppressor [Stigmatella erecta]|uniref:Alpha-tubulin suppressor n=2 Tax=Stigmatella erecta TaxID=83460 RepID=A0A1I0IQA1_9BACT|nr:Alpha-tubulin suppressor [Stigmatella erecta]